MQVEAVKFLLENGADVHQRVNNLPPLAHAASRLERGPELLQMLMDHGANLNTVSRPDCRNVLHCAAAVGTVETIEFLVKKGGMDLEKKCKIGCTPLLVAARAGNIRNAKALLNLGAKLHAVSENGGTPLIWSSTWNNVEAVKFWLGTDVDIDAQDCYGRSKCNSVICTSFISMFSSPHLDARSQFKQRPSD
jgi:ankyrin repeat protein